MSDNNKAIGKYQNQFINIVFSQWQILGAGSSHIVFHTHRQQLKNKVIYFCIHQANKLPNQFVSLYENKILKTSRIYQYLLEMQKLTFQQQQNEKITKWLSTICKSHSIKYKSNILCGFIAENLKNSGQYDYYLEFKPKTIIPQRLSANLLQKLNDKYQIKIIQEQLYASRPQIQKTRWFKKQLRKKQHKNMNPFQIYQFKSSDFPNIQNRIKKLNNNQSIPYNTIAENIKQTLKQSQVLRHVLSLQLLNYQQLDNIITQEKIIQNWASQIHKQQICLKIQQNIKQKLININPYEIIQKIYKNPNNIHNCNSLNIYQNIMNFLISWTWRDCSLIIRLKLIQNSNQIKTDIKIIDYQIKQIKKITTIVQKSKQYLQQYLKFRSII